MQHLYSSLIPFYHLSHNILVIDRHPFTQPPVSTGDRAHLITPTLSDDGRIIGDTTGAVILTEITLVITGVSNSLYASVLHKILHIIMMLLEDGSSLTELIHPTFIIKHNPKPLPPITTAYKPHDSFTTLHLFFKKKKTFFLLSSATFFLFFISLLSVIQFSFKYSKSLIYISHSRKKNQNQQITQTVRFRAQEAFWGKFYLVIRLGLVWLLIGSHSYVVHSFDLLLHSITFIIPLLTFFQCFIKNSSKYGKTFKIETPRKLLLLLQPFSKIWIAAWLEHAACQLHAVEQVLFAVLDTRNLNMGSSHSFPCHLLSLIQCEFFQTHFPLSYFCTQLKLKRYKVCQHRHQVITLNELIASLADSFKLYPFQPNALLITLSLLSFYNHLSLLVSCSFLSFPEIQDKTKIHLKIIPPHFKNISLHHSLEIASHQNIFKPLFQTQALNSSHHQSSQFRPSISGSDSPLKQDKVLRHNIFSFFLKKQSAIDFTYHPNYLKENHKQRKKEIKKFKKRGRTGAGLGSSVSTRGRFLALGVKCHTIGFSRNIAGSVHHVDIKNHENMLIHGKLCAYLIELNQNPILTHVHPKRKCNIIHSELTLYTLFWGINY
ncbi:hypothetical protein VP01_2842g1 [Puccinia sorghi]|uniref:Uncharacterized protein n=1 Tax=Puccinia sorghi TaxID=27349 RepID=A0A0L6V230_9BASI|nr:hypothetical protein VP01_2842g1 [Puccinia sorghi]